jgi:hypothetical protein
MGARPTCALGVLAAAAALAISGCGAGSAHTSASQQSTPSGASRFAAQAEHICARVSAEEAPLKARQEALKRVTAGSPQRAFVALAHQLVAISRAAKAKLEALPRPAGDETKIATLLTVYGDEIADVATLASAVANQEGPTGEGAESALKRAIAVSRGEAKRFGLERCMGT